MVATCTHGHKSNYFKLSSKPHKSSHSCIPESNSQWEDVDECIDLEDTEKENSKVLKGLGEEVPEQTKVGGLVRDRKTANKCNFGSIYTLHYTV